VSGRLMKSHARAAERAIVLGQGKVRSLLEEVRSDSSLVTNAWCGESLRLMEFLPSE
jgi:hypothetical protein